MNESHAVIPYIVSGAPDVMLNLPVRVIDIDCSSVANGSLEID